MSNTISPKAAVTTPVAQQPVNGNLPGNQPNASFIDRATDAYLDTASKIGVGLTSAVVGGGALYASGQLLAENGKVSLDLAKGAYTHAMEGDIANALVDSAVAIGSTLPAIAVGVGAYHVGANYVQNRQARNQAAQQQSSIS